MTVHYSLRCMKCYKKWERAWLLSAGNSIDGSRDSQFIKWRNVSVIGETKNETPICKCGNCGHTYKSNSSAARRALRWAKENGELGVNHDQQI